MPSLGLRLALSIQVGPRGDSMGGLYQLAAPEGMTLSRNVSTPNTHLDIAAGRVILDGVSARYMLISGSSFTKRIDQTWVAGTGNGGRFSGTLGPNQTWHVFAMRNESSGTAPIGTVDFGFDSSPVGANRPVGWSVRRIGSWLLDNANNLRDIIQTGNWFTHRARLADSLTSISIGSALYSLNIPTGLKLLTLAAISAQASGSFDLIITDPDGTDSTVGPEAFSTASNWARFRSLYLTNTSRQIRVRVVATALSNLELSTIGWFDDRSV